MDGLGEWAGRKGGKFRLPTAHEPFMSGQTFSCATCRFLKDRDQKTCGEPNFARWNGSDVIPADDLSRACSDWFEPA